MTYYVRILSMSETMCNQERIGPIERENLKRFFCQKDRILSQIWMWIRIHRIRMRLGHPDPSLLGRIQIQLLPSTS
jgi:hypothetical protein